MWGRRRRSREDFAEELQSHLNLEADELRERGLREGAEQRARRAFGNVTATEEAFYERGRWLFLDQVLRDLRHGLRLMRLRPGFSAVVVLTLAVGIGANSAIFSLVNAVLLRPLPFQEPQRLAMLWMDNPAENDKEGRVSLPNFTDWKAQSRTFEDMTLFIGQTFLLGPGASPERMREARVPANFFSLLGVQPILGRVFSPEEEERGERVVLLSHALWQREFAGGAEAVGADLVMDGRKSRIVGVMPAQFQFPFADTQVWEPITTHPYWAARNRNSPRTSGDWFVLGRVKRGVTWPRAQAEMDTIARRLAAAYPESDARLGINVTPLSEQATGKSRRSLMVLFAAVFLMLLIACINVANLLLARGSVREREFAVRRALGASRGQLAGQLMTESLVLAGCGGALGLLFAGLGLRALVRFGPQDIPRLGEAHLDLRVLVFTLLISLFAAVASGLWPATVGGTAETRGRQWSTVANRRVRSVLVVSEFSLALVLLTGAGLLVHSFLRLTTVDPGFRPENLLVLRVDLHVGKNAAQRAAYFRAAVERAQALPGVRSAAAIGRFLSSYGDEPVTVEGRAASETFQAADDVISGPYFRTAGIPLKEGRVFSDQDREGSVPVAIINETMARSFWPNQSAVGKRFAFSSRKGSPLFTVVGVAGDMHRQGLENNVRPQVFRPHSQSPENEMDVLVRTASDPLSMAAAVRDSLQSIDKTVPKFGVMTVAKQMGQQTAERRFDTSLLGIFSLVALFLSGIGIYGLMHHFVVQRTNEIGVRVALGAGYGDVMRLVFTQGLTLAGVGVTIGVLGALGLTRLLSSLLYGVTSTDPVTFALAPAVLLAIGALGCLLPAWRASQIDPVRALRESD